MIAGIGLQWLEFKATAEIYMGLCLFGLLAFVGIAQMVQAAAQKIRAFFKKK